ncbi:MAG TPA: hypothetical protein VJH95_00300 [Candidatus Nanoarchaeia archaeon]|nr:hypothetical protein [Candidatus Nanoarchaeia archaeon]
MSDFEKGKYRAVNIAGRLPYNVVVFYSDFNLGGFYNHLQEKRVMDIPIIASALLNEPLPEKEMRDLAKDLVYALAAIEDARRRHT